MGPTNPLALTVVVAVPSACGGDDGPAADAPSSEGGGPVATVHTVPQLEPVARGELDAALVFRTFVPIPDRVEVVSIRDDENPVIDVRYAPVAAKTTTDAFQEFLQSDAAEQVLTQQGFLP